MRRGPWGSALRARLPFRTAHPSQGPRGGRPARSCPSVRSEGASRSQTAQGPAGGLGDNCGHRGARTCRCEEPPPAVFGPLRPSFPPRGDPQPPNCGLPLPRDSVVAEAGPSLKGTRNGSKRDWKMSFYKKRCILENSFPLTYVKTNCVNIKKPYCPKGQSPGSGREQQRSGLRGPVTRTSRPDFRVAPAPGQRSRSRDAPRGR